MPRGGAATSIGATLSRYEFEFARDEFIDKLSFIVDKGIQSGQLRAPNFFFVKESGISRS